MAATDTVWIRDFVDRWWPPGKTSFKGWTSKSRNVAQKVEEEPKNHNENLNPTDDRLFFKARWAAIYFKELTEHTILPVPPSANVKMGRNGLLNPDCEMTDFIIQMSMINQKHLHTIQTGWQKISPHPQRSSFTCQAKVCWVENKVWQNWSIKVYFLRRS